MRLFRNILFRALLFLAMTAIEGCTPGGTKYVYAIVKTRSYHRANCAPVHMANAIRMTLDEAKSEQLKPCPICRPDRD